MKMKDNVLKSWKTTLIGNLIILASVVSVFVPELNTTWKDAAIGIFVGGLFWLMPDKLLGLAGKRLNEK